MYARYRHRTRLLALAIVAMSLAATRASAAPLALWLDGPEALRLRGAIVAALPAAWTALPSVTHAHAASRATLGERMRALGERVHAQAVLYARVEPRKHAVLLVVTRAGAAPLERHASPRALAPAIAELLRAPAAPAPALAPPVAAATRTPTSPAIPAATSAESPSTPETTLVARAAPPPPPGALFSIALDGGVAARRLAYNQALTQNLPTYSVAAVPFLGFRAALSPFARTGLPFLRGLGAVGAFGHSLYQQSEVAGTTGRVSATWMTYDVGLREGIDFATARAGVVPTLGVAFAYGREAYLFDDGGIPLGQTPSVDYRYLRPAVDGRVSVGRVTFFADFGYRAVLSSGYIGSRFPRASVGGLDVGAGAAVALPRNFTLALRGRYERFFYDLHPQPGDPYVAGGALDELGVGELALAYGF